MQLWIEWFRCVHQLRGACSRQRSFLWMALVLAAMAIRSEILGVTSFVRASFLNPSCYELLLHFFHSSALPISLLLEVWVKLVMKLFSPVTEDGYVIFAADGLKVPKGFLQHLAINFRNTVWTQFKSWLRTMKTDLVPSEMVVSYALKSSFLDFLVNTNTEPELKKFILDRVKSDRIPGVVMAA